MICSEHWDFVKCQPDPMWFKALGLADNKNLYPAFSNIFKYHQKYKSGEWGTEVRENDVWDKGTEGPHYAVCTWWTVAYINAFWAR